MIDFDGIRQEAFRHTDDLVTYLVEVIPDYLRPERPKLYQVFGYRLAYGLVRARVPYLLIQSFAQGFMLAMHEHAHKAHHGPDSHHAPHHYDVSLDDKLATKITQLANLATHEATPVPERDAALRALGKLFVDDFLSVMPKARIRQWVGDYMKQKQLIDFIRQKHPWVILWGE